MSRDDVDRAEPRLRGPGRKPTISLATITGTALELLDEVGLAELSTRRLAAKLGVRSPTLYWHVRNKAELLDLVAEAVCADAFVIDRSLPWREQLAGGLHQFRAILLTHRDVAELLRTRPPTGPHRLAHVETTMQILAEAGFSDVETAAISQLLTAHVLNSVSDGGPTRGSDAGQPTDPEQAGAAGEIAAKLRDYPHFRRVLPIIMTTSDQEKFDLGVEIILGGLAQRALRR